MLSQAELSALVWEQGEDNMNLQGALAGFPDKVEVALFQKSVSGAVAMGSGIQVVADGFAEQLIKQIPPFDARQPMAFSVHFPNGDTVGVKTQCDHHGLKVALRTNSSRLHQRLRDSKVNNQKVLSDYFGQPVLIHVL